MEGEDSTPMNDFRPLSQKDDTVDCEKRKRRMIELLYTVGDVLKFSTWSSHLFIWSAVFKFILAALPP